MGIKRRCCHIAEKIKRKPLPKPAPKTPTEKALEKAKQKAAELAIADFKIANYRCGLCGEYYEPDQFYDTSDPMSLTGKVPICKQCAERVAYQINRLGDRKKPTKDSVKQTLFYLNKPWLESVWDAAVQQASTSVTKGQGITDMWKLYITKINMARYGGMTFMDSDFFHDYDTAQEEEENFERDQEILEMCEHNRKAVIKSVGYDPFESLDIQVRPVAYSRLMGLLDESAMEDELKLGACIEITQSLVQSQKLDDMINHFQSNADSLIKNANIIKTLQDVRNKTMKTASDLARENGISEINNKKNSKGGNTWTGQVKKLREMNLREAEINAFDIGTAKGMAQVAELSNAAIMKTLSLDENDYTDMIKTQKSMIDELQRKCEAAEEESRIFRRENSDLKAFLMEKGLLTEDGQVVDE